MSCKIICLQISMGLDKIVFFGPAGDILYKVFLFAISLKNFMKLQIDIHPND